MRSLIRKSVSEMSGYTPGEQTDSPGIIKLNTNENPYPPSSKVESELAALSSKNLRLYPDPLCLSIRAKLAEIHGCSVENVFVGNGSDEVLALCTRAFVENDGSIGYLEPSYSLYPVLSDIRDVKKSPVALNSDFSWDIPESYTASLFLLTNPNAPTGMFAPCDHVREFCDRFSGVVVVDEAYVDFSSSNCMHLALSRENVIVARSLSKSFSLAGIRLGYAVGSEALISAMFTIKDSYNVDYITQRIALAALSDLDHMRRNVNRIVATRKRLASELQLMGHYVVPSETNFLWLKPSGISAKDLFEMLRKKGILIRYFAGGVTKDFVRITVGTDDEIDKLIEAIK